MNMAGNREGVRLCVEMTLVIMDKAERWLNDFLFASVNTNFMRPELFSKRLFVIAEDKNNTGVMRLTNLLAKCRKLIENLLCTSGSSMKEIACDQQSPCPACLYDAGKSLEVVLCRTLRNRYAGMSERCRFSKMDI
jgi:hypothetical protein